MASTRSGPSPSGWEDAYAVLPADAEVRAGRPDGLSLDVDDSAPAHEVARHGRHPAPPSLYATRVPWSPCTSRTARVRVRDYTCECLPLVFELCVSAGLAFVRRRQLSPARLLITESEWTTRRQAEALWTDLMNGQAR